MGEMSGGDEATGGVQKMEEAVGVLVIIEVYLSEDLAGQKVGWIVAFHDPLEKVEWNTGFVG